MKSFEKGEVLTADRLNELLAATAGTADTAGRTVPPRPGIKAQPGLARFNMQAEDACAGEVGMLPDYAGMVKAVGYEALDAPRINRGKIQLPLAHDFDTADDSSLPPEQATGGICSINVPENLKRAQINRGDILLPLAHSDWGEAEGAMCTPGLVYAVQMDAEGDDECSGTVGGLPYIDQGVIHLPAGGGGGGGALSGVVNTSGEQVPWSQMQAAPVKLAVFFLDGYRLYLTGQVVNGFLQFNTEAV